MANRSLYEIYTSLQPNLRHLFVVPLIRYNFPVTDYLSLLYKPIEQDHPEVIVHSTSVFGHFGFVWAQLIGKKPILHYHWLEFHDIKSLLGIKFKLICIAMFTLFGGKLVWTVHNLSPHSKKWRRSNQWMHQWMARRSHVLLVHSPNALKLAAKYLRLSTDKLKVYPHPKFPATYLPKKEAILGLERQFTIQLKQDHTIFLMAGAISSYKQIPAVIKTLQDCTGNWQLLITGYVKKGQQTTHQLIEKMASNDSRILYHPTFISEKSYPALHIAADVCVFNFDEILTSGGVEMADAYHKKIIAPNIGGLVDLANQPNVQLFSTTVEFQQLLQKAIDDKNHG